MIFVLTYIRNNLVHDEENSLQSSMTEILYQGTTLPIDAHFEAIVTFRHKSCFGNFVKNALFLKHI